MTREEILKILEMRMDGYTLGEIGEQVGVSRQRVDAIIKGILNSKASATSVNKCIYPGLKKWMLENGVTCYKMSKELGLKNNTSFVNYISGESKFTIDRIKAIIKYTGRSFEELFGGESNDQESF